MKAVSQQLYESGINFIDQSIDDFAARRYKYSVLHFAAGIEVILKARIVHEDWRLIVHRKKRMQVTESGFASGDFYSIKPSDCIKCLQDELKIEVPKCGANFDLISQLRNKAVHFILTDEDGSIELLQYHAYNDLRRFIRSNQYVFRGHRNDIKRLFQKLGDFVGTRFEKQIEGLNASLTQRLTYLSRQLKLEDQFELGVWQKLSVEYLLKSKRSPLYRVGKIVRCTKVDLQHNKYSLTINQDRNGWSVYEGHEKCANQGMVVLFKDEILSKFYQYVLTFNSAKFYHTHKQGSMLPFVSRTDFEQFLIPSPPTEVMRTIVATMDAFAKRKQLLKGKLDALIEFDKGVKQQKYI
ncbi:type I restriction modification DNA specificity protein [Neolewinella xylanilytica]|uniref:Type I restriction modification DNA specificity protein n=1 Tax=Neolewinella xylanilytica TaxID=1514080 RepID=A0A2S6IA78_9BACT|nr:restriction endonuclease subunit S [Neolewinella xylanilytica]PPK88359.1 type I restriction modification DNA specificity protein [Neolewinella xylanilytica]